MLFLGDIAVPENALPAQAVPESLFSQPVVANFEGAACVHANLNRGKRVWNAQGALAILDRFAVRVAGLANNHILDTCNSPEHTMSILQSRGCSTVGAGASLSEAAQPTIINEDNTEIALLAFGWHVIGCREAGLFTPGVNPLRPEHVLRSLDGVRMRYRSAQIVLLMHWNYELEVYPQPMHRQLAFECIRRGASAVIGCHPHCPGGIEWHESAPVVYSLGNWFFPQGVFFGGNLRFPPRARLQLAFEWDPRSGTAVCHWFDYSPGTHRLTHISSEAAQSDRRIAELTPFDGMSHREYTRWFAAHRFKRRGLPIYRDYRNTVQNWAFDHFVRLRQTAVNMMFNSGIRRSLSGTRPLASTPKY